MTLPNRPTKEHFSFLPPVLLLLSLGVGQVACCHPDPLENIKIYTYIISVSPDNHYAYLNRGISYRMVSDFHSAIEDFNRAEQMGATGRYLWMNRAMTQVTLDRFDKAIEDLNRILDLAPEDPSCLFYRGEIYFRKKNYRRAIADYTRSLDSKETAHVFFVRADAHRLLGEYEKAIADYTEAISRRPYTTGFILARAKCFGQMGHYEAARADLDSAEEKQPERYQIYIERAVLSASQSFEASKTADIRTSLKYLEDELFFRPKDPKVFADRAKVHELAGDWEKAKEDLDLAVEYADWNDETYLELRADLLERIGKIRAAEADRQLAAEVANRPVPTATPLPGPTLTMQEIQAQPTPNLLPGLAR